MNLLINATMVGSEGGITLLLDYVTHFLADNPTLSIRLYLNPELAERVNNAVGQNARLSVVSFRPPTMLARLWWEQVTLPRIIRREGIDCLFSYTNTGPLLPGCRQILYIQQAIPYTAFKPRHHQLKWAGLVWLFRVLIGIAQLGSARIVVQTRWLVQPVRASLLNLLPPERYIVTLPGLPSTQTVSEPVSTSERKILTEIGHLKEQNIKLIFYPAFLAPYKHIPYLLQAIKTLQPVTETDFRVILTFNRDSSEYFPCKQEIFELIPKLGLEEALILTGTLSKAAMNQLYQVADVIAFPSKAESLGLPLLEALERGLPIVACRQQENFAEEICGEAALYADPDHPEEFALKLKEILENPALRDSLANQARQRIKHLSWERHIQEILH